MKDNYLSTEKSIEVIVVGFDSVQFATIENTLDSILNIIDGYMEYIRIKDPYIIVCNEEGRYVSSKNRQLKYESGNVIDIYGRFLIVKYDYRKKVIISLSNDDFKLLNKFIANLNKTNCMDVSLIK